jgi:protein-S-isoprenylcysteine O-methyltransferase Ste14
MRLGGITMQPSRRSFGLWATIARADLVLIGVYACFVAINLSAAWRGDLSVLILILQECCVIGLALVRRPATMAMQWESSAALLSYIGTLAPLFVRPAALAPFPWSWIGLALQGSGNVLAFAGICDLGRSFGIVAAHRGIKTRGLYRIVRHPIYAAYLLAFGGFVLAHPSVFNTVVLLVWATIQMARIRAEEHLLSADPQYAAYAMRVRHRLIPGIW